MAFTNGPSGLRQAQRLDPGKVRVLGFLLLHRSLSLYVTLLDPSRFNHFLFEASPVCVTDSCRVGLTLL
jgi:hypothetical protein